jgi:hypothetical protein
VKNLNFIPFPCKENISKRSKKYDRERYKKQTFEKKNEAAAKATTTTATDYKVGQQEEA